MALIKTFLSEDINILFILLFLTACKGRQIEHNSQRIERTYFLFFLRLTKYSGINGSITLPRTAMAEKDFPFSLQVQLLLVTFAA